MKKFLLLLFVINALGLQAQIVFQNPSFEGVSQAHTVPAPWVTCFEGGSPDTQPGQWGITAPGTAGQTYVSFLMQGDTAENPYTEGLSQQLLTPLNADSTYSFSIDIAFSAIYNTAEPGDCYGSLGVWGGFGECGKTELLWDSGPIINPGWHTRTITITPSQNYTHLSFGNVMYTPCNGFLNILLDNLRPVTEENGEHIVYIINPFGGQDVNCGTEIICITDTIAQQVSLLGSFIGSPIQATQVGPTTWKATVTYPQSLLGSSQIVAVADFGNNMYDSYSSQVNITEPIADFTYFEGCSGHATIFYNVSDFASPDTIFSHWDFGDNTYSDSSVVHHIYQNLGVYTVQLTTGIEGYCTYTITREVDINNLPPPQPIIGQNSINLIIENYCPSCTYTWYQVLYTDWDTLVLYYGSSPSIEAGIGTYFFVEVEDLNGDNMFCRSVSDIFYVEHVGISENIVPNISIYPNPINNQLNIELPATVIGTSTLQICNPLGQILYSQVLPTNGKYVFSDIGLSTGYYLLRITNRDFQYTTKLLVN